MTQAQGPTTEDFDLPLTGTATVPWRYATSADHVAWVLDADGRLLDTLTHGEDFTITPSGNTLEGVGVMTVSATLPGNAATLRLSRETPDTQTYVATPGAEAIAVQLDRQTLREQELASGLRRTLRSPANYIPPLVPSANGILAWNNEMTQIVTETPASLLSSVGLTFGTASGVYPTLPDLINDPDLASGAILGTLGIATAGDGGAALYDMVTEADYGPTAPDGFADRATANGLVARLIRTQGQIIANQWGVRPGANNTAALAASWAAAVAQAGTPEASHQVTYVCIGIDGVPAKTTLSGGAPIIEEFWVGTTRTLRIIGFGPPNGVVAAPKGSTYDDIDPNAVDITYVKRRGSGTTGWKVQETSDVARVGLGLGQSNLRGNPDATSGSHAILPDVYAWDTNMQTGTTVFGTQWVPASFGAAPFNVGSAPFANSALLHYANAARRRTGQPFHILPIGRGGTRIEAWIPDAVLAANNWSRGAEQDLTAMMVPGIANALALVPGAPTKLDEVIIIHGGANQDDMPEILAAKYLAVIDSLGSLVDKQVTPIIICEMGQNEGTPNRERHLSALWRLAEDLPTLRILRSNGLEALTPGNEHFSGKGLVDLGTRGEQVRELPPARIDYRAEPTLFGPNIGWRYFTSHGNRTNFDIAQRPAYELNNPLSVAVDAAMGWAFVGGANLAYNFWSRRVYPMPRDGVLTIAIKALTTTVASTVKHDLAANQWDKDGMSLGQVEVRRTHVSTDGVAALVARFGANKGIICDKVLDPACAFVAIGLQMGVGADNAAFKFNVDALDVSPASQPAGMRSFTVGQAPSAADSPYQLIFVTNEVGGAVMAFSDGTNWRRCTDRAVIST